MYDALLTGVIMDGSEKRRLRLIAAMERLDISQRELARRSGLHWQSIGRYINGTSLLNDVVTLEKLAIGLGVDVFYFFIDDDAHLEILETAATILKGNPDQAEVLTATVSRLRSQSVPQPTTDNDVRKELAEVKDLLRQVLHQPPGIPFNFTRAVAPRKTTPRLQKQKKRS
jgi:transcriptional regulator with XRE-family HTH domain